MPKVSVIIPTYNRSVSLARSIRSVLNQTCADFELIVIDDASTDDTEKEVRKLSDKRIRIIKHSENLGGSAARNTGINNANGRYVAFLDSDDEWLPRKLERQIGVMDTFTSDEWGGVYCGRYDVIRGLRTITQPNLEGSFTFELLSGGGSIAAGSTLMVKKECMYRINGFDASFRRFQDLEMLLRFFKYYKLKCLKEPLVVINRYYKTSEKHIEKDMLRLISLIKDNASGLKEREMRRILGFRYILLAENLLEGCGTTREGISYFLKAIKKCPYLPLKRHIAVLCLVIARITGVDLRWSLKSLLILRTNGR